jgi:hypothetical protein
MMNAIRITGIFNGYTSTIAVMQFFPSPAIKIFRDACGINRDGGEIPRIFSPCTRIFLAMPTGTR